jgi:imidazole glycerol-phosphate synthase subunit HisH
MDVAVVKLGVGNIASVLFALERLRASALLTDDPSVIAEAPRVILPGVGSAGHAAERLKSSGLDRALRTFTRPLLGICLGQQLLYERSEEGDVDGLSFFAGSVSALPKSATMPSPHMGWSEIYLDRPSALTEGVRSATHMYFVHSYACPISSQTIAIAQYGRPFSAIVGYDNVFGCQFHPERSGEAGARILQNFLALPC